MMIKLLSVVVLLFCSIADARAIIEQRVDRKGIYIRTIEGEFSLTRQEIRNIYASKTGSASTRRTATINDLKSRIENAFPDDPIPASRMILDFDTADGSPRTLEVSSR